MQKLKSLPLILIFFSFPLLAAIPDGIKRNYDAAVTPQQKKDIAYIIKNMADSSLTSLWKNKYELEKAGERIEGLHPLQFMYYVFSNEELKVGLHNIRTRGGWVAKEFFTGTNDSFSREYHLNNLTHEYVCDFSSRLGISPEHILPYVHQQKWDALIDKLIELLPRTGDHDRYDF